MEYVGIVRDITSVLNENNENNQLDTYIETENIHIKNIDCKYQ